MYSISKDNIIIQLYFIMCILYNKYIINSDNIIIYYPENTSVPLYIETLYLRKFVFHFIYIYVCII